MNYCPADRLTVKLCSDSICLDISAQNAGIFLKRRRNDVVIGCYEVSATNSAVMKAVALRRTFPSRTIALPARLLQDKRFLSEISTALARLDTEQVQAVMPKTKRAGRSIVEERETTNPTLVTDLIMGVLSPHGFVASITGVEKRIRDTVSWDTSKVPWRRLPLWTTIRVSLQLYLVGADPADGELEYKHFVFFLILAIAGVAVEKGCSSNTLFVINAKIAHRVAKLGPLAFEFLKKPTETKMTEINRLLDDRWKEIQTTHNAQLTRPSLLNLSNDKVLRLENSRNYLLSVKNRTLSCFKTSVCHLSSPTRLVTSQSELPNLRLLDSLTHTDVFALGDFEAWVRERLPHWQSTNEYSVAACEELGKLIKSYNTRADAIYDGHAEHLSIKFLAIMELWCALDISVCLKWPLLLDYGPELPVDFLFPILLPKRSDMRRLCRIEDHIRNRHKNAIFKSSAFFSPNSPSSFAAQFYNKNKKAQNLRTRIEAEVDIAREKKREEWQRKSNRYNQCIREANSLLHVESLNSYGFRLHIPAHCHKCILLTESASLTIQRHEWPLPSDEASLKAVIFELICPLDIAAWRDATWMIVQDLGRKHAPAEPTRDYKLELQKCDFLRPYFSANWGARCTLASSTKPFYVTHYGMNKLPIALQDVVVECSLSFQPYDTSRRTWVLAQKDPTEIHRDCITSLPLGPYLDSDFQRTVNSTSHTSNELISEQHACANGLSTEEFLAFGFLRSGIRLQWMNILRELGSDGIRLNSRTVDILICQVAWQVGTPLSSHNELRVAHEIFLDPAFCLRLLRVLEDCYCQIEANWSQVDAMRVVLHVLLRILSLTSQAAIVALGLTLLRKVRLTLYTWATRLLRLHSEPESSMKLQDILEVSLLCQETFNVELNLVDDAIFESEDVTIFVACAVSLGELLTNEAQEEINSENGILRGELIRYLKLCHLLEPKLLSLSEQRSSDISNGLRSKWENAASITKWERTQQCWVRGSTNTTPFQVADFNVCSGELLIDGRPIKKLPDSFTQDPLYRRLFGGRSFDVTVSDILSMEYMTSVKVHGRAIHFSIDNGDLVVRCSSDEDSFEAVPPYAFAGDIPQTLIDGHSHWVNLSTLDVSFYPDLALWEHPLEQRWDLLYSPTGSVMRSESKFLIDPGSDTFKRMVEPFEVFEPAAYLEVTCSENGKLEINIPRYKLHFFLFEF